jgi:hypothetical protein
MALPRLISDLIAPAWTDLTPEQRVCWHFTAATRLFINAWGNREILPGYQYFYERNNDLSVIEPTLMLEEPPPNHKPPQQVAIVTVAWPLGSQIQGTTTARRGYAFLELDDVLPADTAAIVTQGYYQNKTRALKKPRIRHVTVIEPLATGTVNLVIPTGYYATTSGDNRFARIRGIKARQRPDLPLGTLKVVNIETGQTIRQILSNPNGGTPSGINRPRATAYKPTAGDHYP